MAVTFPFFEVLNHETGLPVSVAVCHVRSVRPIRELAVDNDDITRIEYGNGDSLDCSESVTTVLLRIEEALQPVTDWLASVRLFTDERTD
jgi:hypothetical protein